MGSDLPDLSDVWKMCARAGHTDPTGQIWSSAHRADHVYIRDLSAQKELGHKKGIWSIWSVQCVQVCQHAQRINGFRTILRRFDATAGREHRKCGSERGRRGTPKNSIWLPHRRHNLGTWRQFSVRGHVRFVVGGHRVRSTGHSCQVRLLQSLASEGVLLHVWAKPFLTDCY